MPKTIADLAAGTISATTQLEVQNGSDGQKITGQNLLDFVGANVSAIKSIQRGVTNVNADGNTTITISAVDISKSFLTINNVASSGSSLNFPVVKSLNSTSIVLGTAFTTGLAVNTFWQVVEYN